MDQNLSSKISIHISGRNLPDKDTFSKSDPICLVSVKDSKTNRWIELGRTEQIANNLNPDFHKVFTVDYYFEAFQELWFQFYDVDSNSSKLTDHDFLGQCRLGLGEIVAATGGVLEAQLYANNKPVKGKGNKPSLIIVRSETLQENNKQGVVLKFKATGLPKMDWFGKSDPFLDIFRVTPTGMMVKVHRTEVIHKNLNPAWKQLTLMEHELCNGDPSATIVIVCYDWDKNSSADYIGEVHTTLQAMLAMNSLQGDLAKSMPFRRVDKKHRSTMQLSQRKLEGAQYGNLVVEGAGRYTEPSFVDYIRGGMQIGLTVAIDYTGSNGDPRTPNSLHFLYGNEANEYLQALQSIGPILAPYDHDDHYNMFGFGGKLNATGKVSHCFPLSVDRNGQPSAEVHGVFGMLNAYKQSFANVLLSGPTLFAEVIQTATSIADSIPFNQHQQSYQILLIITDGCINDMQQTIAAIVAASFTPLSIIIVGVGPADFSNMNVLDADDTPLSAGGRMMARDIVQFVPFARFKHNAPQLAAEVLREIPGQVVTFAKSRGIQPNPPLTPADPAYHSSVHRTEGPVDQYGQPTFLLREASLPPQQPPFYSPQVQQPQPSQGVVQGNPMYSFNQYNPTNASAPPFAQPYVPVTYALPNNAYNQPPPPY